MKPLRTQEECIEAVKKCIYDLPAKLRKKWKPVWEHLYEKKPPSV